MQMYIDAAKRKIKDPIDYLIEASKNIKKVCIPLHLDEYRELSEKADALNREIVLKLESLPIEEWETSGWRGIDREQSPENKP